MNKQDIFIVSIFSKVSWLLLIKALIIPLSPKQLSVINFLSDPKTVVSVQVSWLTIRLNLVVPKILDLVTCIKYTLDYNWICSSWECTSHSSFCKRRVVLLQRQTGYDTVHYYVNTVAHKNAPLPQGFPLLQLSGKLPFHTHSRIQLAQGTTVSLQ